VKSASVPACIRRLIGILVLVAAVGSSYAAQTNSPPAAELPFISPNASRPADDPDKSAWPVAERADFASLLAGGHFSWLVAPTQVQKEGFAQAERSLFSAMIAEALVRANVQVPDTYVVDRALGGGKRRLRVVDIATVAELVGATNVLVPYLGHDETGELTLTIAVYRKPTSSAPLLSVTPQYLTWDKVRYSEEMPPAAALSALMPEILQRLGVTSQDSQSTASPPHALELPQSPELLVKTGAATDPLGDAARFAVLAALTPPDTRAAERLFEKTLLSAQQTPSAPEQAFLRAYALYHLGLRPAAIRALLGSNSQDTAALSAIINGNFIGTETLVNQTSGYKRVLLELELHDLARQYGRDETKPLTPTLAALAGRDPAWSTLLGIRWDFFRPWPDQDNTQLKRLLDQKLPVPGQSLAQVVAAHRVTPAQALTWSDLQLSARDHIRAYMKREQTSLCCTTASGRPGTLDFLALVDSWSDRRTMCVIDRELRMRGLPEQAASMLKDIERFYSGDPEFEVLEAQVNQALANKLPAAERATNLKDARHHAFGAILRAQGQTSDAIEALSILTGNQDAKALADGYAHDFPLNPYWLSNDYVIDPKERLGLARTSLANTQTGVGYIELMLLDGGDSVKAEGVAALKDRFLGNPGRDKILEKLIPPSSDDSAILARLQAGIRAQPESWDARVGLGGYLISRGKHPDALKAFTQYPGFAANSSVNAIGLSNDAGQAGDMLYWHGATREARQMYVIATRYGVGSEAEMTSATQLRLIDGDLQGALEAAHQRAERYPNDESYGIYLSLLHLLGRSPEAWQAFNLLVARAPGPGIWDSAMVGLRMRATTPSELTSWLATPEIARANGRAIPWSAGFILIWTSTDRAAPADLVERIRALAYEPRGVIEGNGRSASYPSAQEGARYLISRSAFRADQRPVLKDQAPTDSDFYYFSQALVALERQDFSGAVSHFDEIAARFPIEKYLTNGDSVYVLPEFAYASSKVSDPLRLEPFVAALPADQQMFESYLATSYFQALIHHDAAAALAALQKALFRIDHFTGRSPSMEYQYANAAERLYRETGDPRFRDAALTWAHSSQALQPWTAWTYTIEAELSPEASRRETALVKALFLDPLSPRLKSIPVGEMQKARTTLQSGNPFLHQSPSERRTHDPAQTANASHGRPRLVPG
jgi:hypothetical protein